MQISGHDYNMAQSVLCIPKLEGDFLTVDSDNPSYIWFMALTNSNNAALSRSV